MTWNCPLDDIAGSKLTVSSAEDRAASVTALVVGRAPWQPGRVV